jgi:hypothetical protein
MSKSSDLTTPGETSGRPNSDPTDKELEAIRWVAENSDRLGPVAERILHSIEEDSELEEGLNS